jgi:Outer membrane protein beta-barrel domain
MHRKILALLAVTLLGVGSAYAQERAAGAGRLEVGAFPGGVILFTDSNNGNDFGNYALGASLTVNINRWIGIEGEGGGSIGVHQSFNVGSKAFVDRKTPNMWSYSGNIVVNPGGNDRALVPYVTGGLGGLTLCPCGEADILGITSYETYFMGNVGGGVKWFSTRHFGVRGDYRFFMVNGNDAPRHFFGVDNRYGHRVQAGLIFTY